MARAKYLQWVGLAALAVLPLVVRSDYYHVLFVQVAIYVILALGLNIVMGFAGQMSLASAAFWGIGAYTSALLTTRVGVSFWLALPAAGLVAAVFGVVLGVPSLKVRGHYLAMVTIGFAEITRLVLMNYVELTGGPNGIGNIPPVTILGFRLSNPARFYYLAIAMAVLAVAFTSRVRHSRIGRALLAIRDQEIVAEAIGIDATLYKVLAFCLSAFLAGVAGSLYAHFYNYICPPTFAYPESVKVLCMLFIGGAGTISGPVIGAMLLTFLPEWLRFLARSYMAVYRMGVTLMMVLSPSGLVGLLGRFSKRPRAARGST